MIDAGKALVTVFAFAAGIFPSIIAAPVAKYFFEQGFMPMQLVNDAPVVPTTSIQPELREPYAWALRSKLNDVGLSYFVQVAYDEDGALALEGELPDDAKGQWREIKNWLATRRQFPPIAERVNFSADVEPLPSLTAVWIDKKPIVVFGDGTVLGMGMETVTGWQISAISTAEVVLVRGVATLTIPY